MGGIISGAGSMFTGLATMTTELADAESEYNAADRSLGQNIRVTQRKSALEAGKLRSQGSQLIARQKVAYANSGVDATVGTPASVMADTRLMSELDAQTAENNAANEVWGFKTQRLAAKDAWDKKKTAAAIKFGSTVASGLGDVVSSASMLG